MREYLNTEGVRIYYKGNIKRGAVVFLHSNSLNALCFREQFRSIHAFPMLAIDLPGHGCSPRAANPGEAYNIPAYALLLARIIRELGLEDVILAGHAMGANIAIEATAHLPDVRALFLFNMSPFSIPPQLDKMCRPNPFLGYLLAGSLRPMEALLLAEEMLEDNVALTDLLASWILETDSAARMSFAASLGLDKFADELGMLQKFSGPVAVLRGRTDRLIHPGYLDHLNPVSLWKNGIIELNAGHIPQMEIPGTFNNLMVDFYRYALNTGTGKGEPGGQIPENDKDTDL